MEISFYHLTTSPMTKALPNLVEKAYEAGHKVQVVGTEEGVKIFDSVLWTFHPRKFLPHGTDRPEKQPIFVTPHSFNANNASIIAITDGRELPNDKYEKALYLFDGNEEESLNTARERWKTYKEAGHTMRYWYQDDAGKWAEKSL